MMAAFRFRYHFGVTDDGCREFHCGFHDEMRCGFSEVSSKMFLFATASALSLRLGA